MLNLSDVTSKFRVVTVFVIVDFQAALNLQMCGEVYCWFAY